MSIVRHVYTDGSANYHTQKGGWGYVELDGDKIVHQGSRHEESTTNNRMELIALIEAIKFYKQTHPDDSVIFYTDSQYVQKGATIWLQSWLRSNWKGNTVKNIDLWENYVAINDGTLKFSIQWVKGHANTKGNLIADALANAAYLQG